MDPSILPLAMQLLNGHPILILVTTQFHQECGDKAICIQKQYTIGIGHGKLYIFHYVFDNLHLVMRPYGPDLPAFVGLTVWEQNPLFGQVDGGERFPGAP